MANLPEIDEFTTGIYQLEITDPVEGGAGGVSNSQAKALANRTLWLKNQLAALATIVGGFTSTITALTTRVTNLEAFNTTTKFVLYLKKGTVSVGDISVDKLITVSFSDVGTSSYMVTGSLVSLGSNYSNDNDVIWMVRNKTATSFQLCLREVTGNVQNLNFDYLLIPF